MQKPQFPIIPTLSIILYATGGCSETPCYACLLKDFFSHWSLQSVLNASSRGEMWIWLHSPKYGNAIFLAQLVKMAVFLQHIFFGSFTEILCGQNMELYFWVFHPTLPVYTFCACVCSFVPIALIWVLALLFWQGLLPVWGILCLCMRFRIGFFVTHFLTSPPSNLSHVPCSLKLSLLAV